MLVVAPKAETIFTFAQRKVVGIALSCPECDWPLRCETVADWPTLNANETWQPVPDLVGNPGPLGFIARCDVCGFRVEMTGNRLATVAMLEQGHGGDGVRSDES